MKKVEIINNFKTIKEMCFYYFKNNKLTQDNLNFITLEAKKIKKDTKFNKYHLSYWKSKFKKIIITQEA